MGLGRGLWAVVLGCTGCMGQVEGMLPDGSLIVLPDGGRAVDSGTPGDAGGTPPDSGTSPPDAGPQDSGTLSTDIIPADRRMDWSRAGVLKPDGTLGIPDPSTGTRCASLTPSNTLADINNAIATCSNAGQLTSSNKEVYLAAGTYVLSDQLKFANARNVTLRGAGRGTGSGATVLQFPGGYSNGGIHIIGSGGYDIIYNTPDPAKIHNWTAGYAQGTTVITLDSVSGVGAGNVLLLDQLNDDVDAGSIPMAQLEVSMNYTQNGGTETSRDKGTRALQQYVRVVSVDAANNQVTIDPGLYMPIWRASQQPQVYLWSDWAEMDGVEDLTLQNTGSAQMNVEFLNCYSCWLRNIESDNSNNAHVIPWEVARIEIRDSYFFATQTGSGDSRGLFVSTGSDDLFINNAFEQITLPISVWGTQGSVVAYNFMDNMQYQTYPAILCPGISTEGGQTSMNLFEGNYGNQVAMDNNHGGGSRNTVFRNRLVGWESGRTADTEAVVLNVMNHLNNFVGNVLGKTGYHDTYETSYANNAHPDTSVYGLGYWIYTWNYPQQYDTAVVTTLLRHGNWDGLNGSIQWDPTISDHALPASLYLTQKPSWWGNSPWPAFDPASPTADSYLNLPAGAAWHAQFPTKTVSEVGP